MPSWMRESMLTDHRGRLVPLMPASALPAAAPRPLRRHLARAHTGLRSMLPAVIGSATGASLVPLLFRGLSAEALLGAALNFMVLAVLLLPAAFFVQRANRPTVSSAVLRERLCPSCGYALRELQPQPDGCVQCPECAAAWRLSA